MFARPRPKKSLLPPPVKRRKIKFAIEEINFDFDARADYLTGFHKRKVQRVKQAQEEAAKKAREERVIARKQLREERRQELEAHVAAVNALLIEAKTLGTDHSDNSEDEVWDGIAEEDTPLESIDHEAEYIDEDRYTTVTVEVVDVSKEGLHKVAIAEDANGEGDVKRVQIVADSTGAEIGVNRKIWPKKPKKKKFRYESKAERKITRGKQKAGNKVKADARRGSN